VWLPPGVADTIKTYIMKRITYTFMTAVTTAVLISTFIIFSFAPLVHAQAPSSSDWDAIRQEIQDMGESVSGLEIPYLEARSIELTEDTYGPGDVVEGIVTVRNGGTISADRIIPTVSLVGDFDGFIPTASYDIDSSQQNFNLAPGETKNIYFEYQLPEVFLNSDLGIQVEFYTDTGLRQDVVFTKFNAVGPFLSVDIPTAKLTLRGREYDLRVTPAVYEGDPFSLNVTFTTEEDITVVPNVKIHVFSSMTGEVVSDTPFNQRVVPAGESEMSLELSPQLPAGMYEGAAIFTDTEGNVIAPKVLFLFMMMGEGTPYMIRNITAAPDTTNPNQQIFTVSYTGGAPDLDIFFEEAPVEIGVLSEQENVTTENQPDPNTEESRAMQSLQTPDYSTMQLAIDITNQSGRSVGGGSVSADSGEDFVVDVPVNTSSIPSGMYTVTAQVTDENGDIIDTYTKEMVLETGTTKTPFSMNLLFLVAVILLVIILIPLSLKIAKHDTSDNV